MNDVPPETIRSASRRFYSVRRTFWRFFICAIFVFVCAAALDPILQNRVDPAIREVFSFVLAMAFLACMIGAFVASCMSQRFRCPRCGRKFIPSFASTWTFSDAQCIRCGLRLERRLPRNGEAEP